MERAYRDFNLKKHKIVIKIIIIVIIIIIMIIIIITDKNCFVIALWCIVSRLLTSKSSFIY